MRRRRDVYGQEMRVSDVQECEAQKYDRKKPRSGTTQLPADEKDRYQRGSSHRGGQVAAQQIPRRWIVYEGTQEIVGAREDAGRGADQVVGTVTCGEQVKMEAGIVEEVGIRIAAADRQCSMNQG